MTDRPWMDPSIDAYDASVDDPYSFRRPGMTLPVWLVGIVYLALAVAATGVLVLSHFDAMHAPGCGAGSACEHAANSKFGNVPLTPAGWANVFTPQQAVGTGVFGAPAVAGPPAWTVGEKVGPGIPVSFLGLAYFGSVLIAWILSYGGMSGALRWFVRAGALVSVGYLVLVFVGQMGCPYCIAAHACNLLIWTLVEFRGRTPERDRRPSVLARRAPGVCIAALVLALTGLGVTDMIAQSRAGENASRALQASLRDMGAGDGATGADPFGGAGLLGDPGLSQTSPDDAPVVAPPSDAAAPSVPEPTPDAAGGPADDGAPSPEATPEPVDDGVTPGADAPDEAEAPGEPEPDPAPSGPTDEANGAGAPGAMGSFTRAALLLALTQPGDGAPKPDGGAAQPDAGAAQPAGAAQADDGGFRGRHMWGDEVAPIRIVMFMDYQCKDCKALDKQVFDLIFPDGQMGRRDITLSVKYFPFSNLCNPYVGQQNLHPNACWAARAAETAFLMKGTGGFWNMHLWLFDVGGGFTTAELIEGLQGLGYSQREITQFLDTMQNDQRLDERIREDIDEGIRLGLRETPMIFINGVHLAGWQQPDALTRTVAALTAQNLPARPHTADRPLSAVDRMVKDWERMPVTNPGRNPSERVTGATKAPVSVVLYGDFQEDTSRGLDQRFRAMIDAGRDIRYEYRHYPWDDKCNPAIQRTVNPLGCMAARAAEAAFVLGGDGAYWKAHAFLMADKGNVGRARLTAFVTNELGLDAPTFLRTMDGPEVSAAIDNHLAMARPLNVNMIPFVLVNGKRVFRPVIPGDVDVIGPVIDRAEALAAEADAPKAPAGKPSPFPPPASKK